jgi:hypothetical protein
MMSTQKPELTVSKPKGIDKKIRSIYVNYMQLMLDAAKDEALKNELFSSNERRLYYLNEKVGMTVPAGVKVMLQTAGLNQPKVYVKDDQGQVWVDEGSEPLKIIDRLNKGETVTDLMAITKPEEVDMDIHDSFSSSNVVLRLPFLDPSKDLTLFELKFDDKEIVLTTCIA